MLSLNYVEVSKISKNGRYYSLNSSYVPMAYSVLYTSWRSYFAKEISNTNIMFSVAICSIHNQIYLNLGVYDNSKDAIRMIFTIHKTMCQNIQFSSFV